MLRTKLLYCTAQLNFQCTWVILLLTRVSFFVNYVLDFLVLYSYSVIFLL
jgi:hypothetical protein